MSLEKKPKITIAGSVIVDEINEIKDACNGKILKVIIETDVLTQEEIKIACEIIVKAKADFAKTSTGFVKNGVGALETTASFLGISKAPIWWAIFII